MAHDVGPVDGDGPIERIGVRIIVVRSADGTAASVGEDAEHLAVVKHIVVIPVHRDGEKVLDSCILAREFGLHGLERGAARAVGADLAYVGECIHVVASVWDVFEGERGTLRHGLGRVLIGGRKRVPFHGGD